MLGLSGMRDDRSVRRGRAAAAEGQAGGDQGELSGVRRADEREIRSRPRVPGLLDLSDLQGHKAVASGCLYREAAAGAGGRDVREVWAPDGDPKRAARAVHCMQWIPEVPEFRAN